MTLSKYLALQVKLIPIKGKQKDSGSCQAPEYIFPTNTNRAKAGSGPQPASQNLNCPRETKARKEVSEKSLSLQTATKSKHSILCNLFKRHPGLQAELCSSEPVFKRLLIWFLSSYLIRNGN